MSVQKIRTQTVTKYVDYAGGQLLISVHQRDDNGLWMLSDFTGTLRTETFDTRAEAETAADATFKPAAPMQPEILKHFSNKSDDLHDGEQDACSICNPAEPAPEHYQAAPVDTKWSIWAVQEKTWADVALGLDEIQIFETQELAVRIARLMNLAADAR